MTRNNSHYARFQSKWVRLPAMIEANRGDSTIVVRIHAERAVTDREGESASIFLTPQEAIGFAAWLHGQAERLVARQAKAAARRAAKLAARNEGKS